MYKLTSTGPRRPTSVLYATALETLFAFHDLQGSGALGIEIADSEDALLTERELVVRAMMDMAVGSRRPSLSRA